MRELMRTNDPVVLSFAEAMLGAAGVGYIVLDQHTSTNLFGVNAISCRLMVAPGQYPAAVRTLEDAGLAHFIHEPD